MKMDNCELGFTVSTVSAIFKDAAGIKKERLLEVTGDLMSMITRNECESAITEMGKTDLVL